MAIVVTGALGFIGSCLVSFLNKQGLTDLILVDDFSKTEKWPNLEGKAFSAKIDREVFVHDMHRHNIDFVFHIGARTDTTEFNSKVFDDLNVDYSKILWNYCTKNNVPLIYASSAATYGDGEHGFDDTMPVSNLKPLNPYGQSKQDFDVWALEQEKAPPFWVGLKYFNVFGPNEYHKGRMASVILHAFRQIKANGEMKLFRSHKPNYKDGEQLRDFIYVKDVVDVCHFLLNHRKDAGIYNLGTGAARTFLDLVTSTFKALKISPNISFIDTPEDIRDKYQYFTEAKMNKLISVGYSKRFVSLEEGIADYVNNYLSSARYY